MILTCQQHQQLRLKDRLQHLHSVSNLLFLNTPPLHPLMSLQCQTNHHLLHMSGTCLTTSPSMTWKHSLGNPRWFYSINLFDRSNRFAWLLIWIPKDQKDMDMLNSSTESLWSMLWLWMENLFKKELFEWVSLKDDPLTSLALLEMMTPNLLEIGDQELKLENLQVYLVMQGEMIAIVQQLLLLGEEEALKTVSYQSCWWICRWSIQKRGKKWWECCTSTSCCCPFQAKVQSVW